MASELKRLENGTIELTLTLPWSDVAKAYDSAVEESVKNAEIKGFRKGHAPRTMVEPQLDKNQVMSHAIQHILPEAYAAAVKEHDLKPILYPQIKVVKGQEGEDWIFTATTCETPAVKLPDYKKSFDKDQKLNDRVEKLVKESKVTIPDLLVEEEANHRLGSLVENLTQLGMNTDQYLASKKLTAEALKAQVAQEAKQALAVEFVLMAVQKEEKLENRQKTLDYLSGLV
jgi:FKBP-type peptidyl-prolyl cis-trans isomerase (trigger factor)